MRSGAQEQSKAINFALTIFGAASCLSSAPGRILMPYSLAEAAKATGTNKTTILRAIKTGKISGAKDELGTWLVEPAELHRVYPPLRSDAETTATHRHALPAAAALEAQLTALRDTAELLRTQLQDVKTDRDHWREQAQTITRQLVDASNQKPWWKRIAG